MITTGRSVAGAQESSERGPVGGMRKGRGGGGYNLVVELRCAAAAMHGKRGKCRVGLDDNLLQQVVQLAGSIGLREAALIERAEQGDPFAERQRAHGVSPRGA